MKKLKERYVISCSGYDYVYGLYDDNGNIMHIKTFTKKQVRKIVKDNELVSQVFKLIPVRIS